MTNFAKLNGLKSGWLFVIGCSVVIATSTSHAQEQGATRTTERVYQFDEHGDAQAHFTFEFDRVSWDLWKSNFGDHPDVFLRVIKHDMAAAVIEDFALEKDDMHRRAVAKFKARALAQYRGNGQFEIPFPKNYKLVTGSGAEWVYMESGSEPNPNGGSRIVNITYRIKLPTKAQNAHAVNGNDFNRLVYSLEISSSKPKTLLYGGVVLLVAAIVSAVAATRAGGRSTAYAPPLPPSTPTALPRS